MKHKWNMKHRKCMKEGNLCCKDFLHHWYLKLDFSWIASYEITLSCPSIRRSICLSVCLSMSLYLSVCPSVRPPLNFLEINFFWYCTLYHGAIGRYLLAVTLFIYTQILPNVRSTINGKKAKQICKDIDWALDSKNKMWLPS